VATALGGVRNQLDAIRALKMQLTSIGTAAREVNAGLDRMRDGVLASVSEAETALRAGVATAAANAGTRPASVTAARGPQAVHAA
ncbi:MAG: hypothetical protein U0869_25005, partial [Chloroflexota bacterium]